MYFFKFVYLVSFVFLLQSINANTIDPKDLQVYPQLANTYTKELPTLNKKLQQKLYKEFMFSFFSPWRLTKIPITKKDAMWGTIYLKSKVYGENYRLIKDKWKNEIVKSTNMTKFDSKKLKAITVRNTNLRIFPSNKPIFKKYTDAGEGFPFDYNQNSSVYINSPLYISHYSKDKAWAFVSANFASGWVMSKDIAIVSDKVIKKFKSEGKYFVAIKDEFPIYKSGIFKDYIKLGTIFPSRNGKFVMVIRDNTGKGYISRIDRNRNIVPFPISFTKNNVNKVINEVIDKPYGWGGLYGNRDCSLLTKDVLTTFGFPMKRNSYAQKRNGRYISLKDKTNEQKKIYIKKHGVPFLSLVYIKGHIALYLGIFKNEPVIFHNIWGIRTIRNEASQRHIIGKSVISSLEIGKELYGYDDKKNLLSKIQGLVILTK